MRCVSIVVRERDEDMKGPGSTLGCKLLSFSYKHSITGQIFSKCLKMAATVYERETFSADE